MINASNAFKKLLYEGKRDYLEYVDMELADGTELSLTNKDLWGGGLTFEDAVSSDSSFDIGAAIINKCTIVINNINEAFSEYDFTGASVVAYVGLKLPDGTTERIKKGTYAVDDAKYNGSIITLSCLDNMRKFDKLYSESSLIYPTTLRQIVRDACSKCDVILRVDTFPHNDHVVNERPADEALTYRSIIAWAAQIAGCFCRCDVYGRLEIKWYDQEALEAANLDGGIFDNSTGQHYMTGDNADGGSFNPWNIGYEFDGGTFAELKTVNIVSANYSMDISTDDVVITGVRVIEKTKEDEKDAIVTYQSGTDGYVVSIEGNDLIQGGTGQQIAEWLGQQLIGFRFRRANVSHPSDPTMEAGDVGFLSDRKGNTYRIVVSSTRFTTGGAQNTMSSAENPARNSAAIFSEQTKNYVENRGLVEKERTDRELAIEQLNEMLENSPGLYRTEDPPGAPNAVQYLHDKPTIAESKTVIKITSEAIGISNDGGKTYPYGLTLDDGVAILNKIYAIGIDADYITTGAFRIEKNGKPIVLMDKDTKQVILRPDVFELSSGKTIEEFVGENTDAVRTELSSSITQTANGIRSEVSRTYSTKSETASAASGAVSSANAATDEKLKSYPTTVAMNSAIDQSAETISLSVSTTYETKADAGSKYSTLESRITITDGKIESKVSKGDVSSQISQEAGKISIKSNRLSITSDGFKLTEAGKITATSGTVGGFTISSTQIVGNNASDKDQIIALQIPSSNMNWALAIGRRTGTGDGQIWDPETGEWVWPSYTYSSCAFRVSKAGELVATSASIKGKIIANDVIFNAISAKDSGSGKYFRGSSNDIVVNGVAHHFLHGIYIGTSATGSPNAPFEI